MGGTLSSVCQKIRASAVSIRIQKLNQELSFHSFNKYLKLEEKFVFFFTFISSLKFISCPLIVSSALLLYFMSSINVDTPYSFGEMAHFQHINKMNNEVVNYLPTTINR